MPLTLQSKVTTAWEKSGAKVCRTAISSRWTTGFVKIDRAERPLIRQEVLVFQPAAGVEAVDLDGQGVFSGADSGRKVELCRG